MPSHDLIDEHGPAPGKPLTGTKVLAVLLGFFAVVMAVDGVMMYFAVSTFSGEVEAHPYERGLAYNRDIAQSREQAARDWKVDVSVARGAAGAARVTAKARDAAGAQASGLAMTATLAAPADKKKDAQVALHEVAPGLYEGETALAPGWRDLLLVAAKDGKELFRSKNRVHVE